MDPKTTEVFDKLFLSIGKPVKFKAGHKTVGGNTSTKYRYGYIKSIQQTTVTVDVVKEDGFNICYRYPGFKRIVREGVNIEDLLPWKPRKKYVLRRLL